jgi:hypothetical protein
LLISYKDNLGYGVDYVDSSNNPYPSGEIEYIIQDEGNALKEKEVIQVASAFLPLNSGESVDIGYKLDRASNYTLLGAVTTAGEKKALLPVTGGRYREIQGIVKLATTTTTSPKVMGFAYQYDNLENEDTLV